MQRCRGFAGARPQIERARGCFSSLRYSAAALVGTDVRRSVLCTCCCRVVSTALRLVHRSLRPIRCLWLWFCTADVLPPCISLPSSFYAGRYSSAWMGSRQPCLFYLLLETCGTLNIVRYSTERRSRSGYSTMFGLRCGGQLDKCRMACLYERKRHSVGRDMTPAGALFSPAALSRSLISAFADGPVCDIFLRC